MPSGEAVTVADRRAGTGNTSTGTSVPLAGRIDPSLQQKRQADRTTKTTMGEGQNGQVQDSVPPSGQGITSGSTVSGDVPPVSAHPRHPHTSHNRADEEAVEEGRKRAARDGDAGNTGADLDRDEETCGAAQGCPRASKRNRDVPRSGTVSPAAEGQAQPSPQPQPKPPTKSSSKFRGVSKTVRGKK